jgi:type IV pilus assembly protein PilM
MAGSYVGLDIGSNLIKVAEVRRAGNQLEVVALGVAPTPQEAYESSTIVDAQLLGQAVKNLLKQSGISSRDCVSSVSGQASVVVRVIEVPQMNPGELAETMKWEVERHVPFAASEVIMDYQPIDRPEGYAEGQNMDVLLAVAQQDMIDRHVEMLFAAGLKPKAIDVEPLAAGRTLLEINPQPGQLGYTVAIVNIGATNTDIGIFRDKLLTFPRTLPLAGDNLTRAIADYLQVDMATAETYKRDLGEVMLDQVTQSASTYSTGLGASGGFIDFGAQQDNPTNAPLPTAAPAFSYPGAEQPAATAPPPTSSPSGRMPFDFSTPGEAPPEPSSAPLDPVAPSPASPFDLQGQPAPHAAPAAAEPVAFPPNPATPPPAPTPQLPVPVTDASGDPAQDGLRAHVFAAMAPVLAELSQELRRSMDYYRGRSSDAQIHEILLVGGTSKLRNLASFLEQELGVPTRVADPLQSVQVSTKHYSQQHLEEIASLFSVSIGLGARDLIAVPGAAGKGKKR